jgi:Zn-dependent oligopeptidase
VAGFPPTLLALTAAAARATGDAGCQEASATAGPWRVTLDHPCLGPLLQHAADPALREEVQSALTDLSRLYSGSVKALQRLSLREEKRSTCIQPRARRRPEGEGVLRPRAN